MKWELGHISFIKIFCVQKARKSHHSVRHVESPSAFNGWRNGHYGGIPFHTAKQRADSFSYLSLYKDS
jgi:hypothetical protein